MAQNLQIQIASIWMQIGADASGVVCSLGA